MSDQPTEARQAPGLTVERSPNFHTIVADLFKMRISPGDCTIICGRSSGVGVIEEQAEILMSWGHLKILAMNLMEMVAAIEKEAGPIPIPRFFYDSGNMRFAANLATIQQLGLVAVPIPFEWDDKAENQSAPNQP